MANYTSKFAEFETTLELYALEVMIKRMLFIIIFLIIIILIGWFIYKRIKKKKPIKKRQPKNK